MSLIIPPGMSFMQALQSGYIKPTRSRAYLDWVKSCQCVVTGLPADDPHHRYGRGWIKGAGEQVSDLWAIPLTRGAHEQLHANPGQWEEEHGSQWYWICLQLERAVQEGVIQL